MEKNNYIAHFTGVGEGCDYTIGCNQKLVHLGGFESMIHAENFAFGLITSNNDNSEIELPRLDMIEKLDIYCVTASRKCNISHLKESEEDRELREEEEALRSEDIETLLRLMRKYPDEANSFK